MRLIDADEAQERFYKAYCKDCNNYNGVRCRACELKDGADIYDDMQEVDAVPVKVIESWLYSIALNNAENSLGDACEEIIKRLDGLVRYNVERKEGGSDGEEPD